MHPLWRHRSTHQVKWASRVTDLPIIRPAGLWSMSWTGISAVNVSRLMRVIKPRLSLPSRWNFKTDVCLYLLVSLLFTNEPYRWWKTHLLTRANRVRHCLRYKSTHVLVINKNNNNQKQKKNQEKEREKNSKADTLSKNPAPSNLMTIQSNGAMFRSYCSYLLTFGPRYWTYKAEWLLLSHQKRPGSCGKKQKQLLFWPCLASCKILECPCDVTGDVKRLGQRLLHWLTSRFSLLV